MGRSGGVSRGGAGVDYTRLGGARAAEPAEAVQLQRVFETNARYYGLSRSQLMENAGREAARFVGETSGPLKRIAVFCGVGNNGGDGFAAARWLSIDKNFVTVYLLATPDKIHTLEARENWRLLEKMKSVRKVIVSDSRVLDSEEHEIARADVVLDFMVGTGRLGELREPIRTAVERINSLAKKVVAVDVPTGFGTPLEIRADVTVSFISPKTPSARVLSIGVPDELLSLTGPGHVQALKVPAPDSYKGQNGILLVIGGGRQYHGAPIFSLRTATRFVGLTYFSSTRENLKLVEKLKLEIADFIAFTPQTLLKAASASDCILVGPGLKPDATARKVVNSLLRQYAHSPDLEKRKKFVLDAGALYSVDRKLLNGQVCITPHVGEFKALFGAIPSPEAAVQMAREHQCVIVLKGNGVHIASPDGRVMRNTVGNEGMAKGGTGDVLAGLVAAFACRNDLFTSACAATFATGFAGDLLKERKGIAFNATDLSEEVPRAVKLLREF